MKRWAGIGLALLLVGCATARERFVVFPMRGQDATQVEKDRDECETLAQTHRNSDDATLGAALGLGVGAGSGAAVGAVAGSFFGRAGWGAGYGAATGAVTGLAAGITAGAMSDHQRYLRIYAVCMASRGYNVAG